MIKILKPNFEGYELFKQKKGGEYQTSPRREGGGGGVILRFGFGGGCAAQASKPLPIFKGHLGGFFLK